MAKQPLDVPSNDVEFGVLKTTPSSKKAALPKCGVIMPISALGDCTEGHWAEVLSIISDAAATAGFETSLVSNADEVTVIQKTIIHNLYNCPVVVCDVSEKNANVMFELGMRLAFDKPTIIIKDDRTNFTFDTGVIEHLEYPRDLRFTKIVDFKKKLAEKVLATFEKCKVDPQFSTFLRHFGQFKISTLEEKEVSGQEFIIEQLSSMQKQIDKIRPPSPDGRPVNFPGGNEIDICCANLAEGEVAALKEEITKDSEVSGVRVVAVGDHFHLMAAGDFNDVSDRKKMERKYYDVAKRIRERRYISRRNKMRDARDPSGHSGH